MDSLHSQYQALLEISEAIASQRELDKLYAELAPRLHRVVQFEFANLILYDAERKAVKSHVLETPDPAYTCPAGDCPMESPGGWVWQTQQPWVVSRLAEDTKFPELSSWLSDRGVQSLCVVPVTTALRKIGALAFGSRHEGVYAEADVVFLQLVARQVAVAVDNAHNFAEAQSVQEQLKEERDRLGLLLEVNNTVVSVLDLHELLKAVSESLHRLMPHEYASLSLYDAESQTLQIHALDFPVSKGLIQEGLTIPVEGSPTGRAIQTRQPVFIGRSEIEQFGSDIAQRILAEGLKSAVCLPLISHGRPLGTIVVASMKEDRFPEKDAALLRPVANQIAIAVENSLAFRQVVERANKLSEEKLYLQDEIRTEYNFEEIIGESPALKHILQQLETVAPTDSTILIRGETGTGKELIARAIHHLSGRRERTLVKVNCAAIPTGLVGKRAVRPRKGRLHRRHRAARRPLRVGPSRHAVPRRGRRYSSGAAAQTLASFAGAGVRAPGQLAHDPRRCSSGRGHQCGPHAKSSGQPISRRSLLPPQCFSADDTAAARAARGHSLAGALLRAKVRAADEAADRNDSGQGDDGAVRVSLARQCPRDGKFHRARGDSFARLRAADCPRGAETTKRHHARRNSPLPMASRPWNMPNASTLSARSARPNG